MQILLERLVTIAFCLFFLSAPIGASAQSIPDLLAKGDAEEKAGSYYQAFLAFEAAADSGSTEAKYRLGSLWCRGPGDVITSVPRATRYLKDAAMNGHVPAATMLAQMYINRSCERGDRTKFDLDPAELKPFFEECSVAGNSECTLYHGWMLYRAGRRAEAEQFMRRAQADGSPSAADYLAIAKFPGSSAQPASGPIDWSKQGVGKAWELYEAGKYSEAYRGFKYHADRGDADAYLGLGNMYEFGHGVGQNATTAMNMYYSAKDRGNLVATFLYGYIIHSGQAWSSSDLKHRRIGIKFIQEAAYAGLPAAKNYLAENAKIVARDQAQFEARLRAIGRPCSDTYIRGETSDGRRYKVMRCE